jgi:hypothetical protein
MCPRDCIDVAQDCIDVSQGPYRCGSGTIDVSQDCIDVAQERNKWGAAVNVVLNLLVSLLASQGPRCL